MTNLLFICLGNICRSPAAEGYMIHLVNSKGLSGSVICDSAGTSAYHAGEPADARMSQAAAERGYPLPSISRQFDPDTDFEKFDLILTMDGSNYDDIISLDLEDQFKQKVRPLTDYCKIHNVDAVPDPYYGGARGFDLVLDIVEDACDELFAKNFKN